MGATMAPMSARIVAAWRIRSMPCLKRRVEPTPTHVSLDTGAGQKDSCNPAPKISARAGAVAHLLLHRLAARPLHGRLGHALARTREPRSRNAVAPGGSACVGAATVAALGQGPVRCGEAASGRRALVTENGIRPTGSRRRRPGVP